MSVQPLILSAPAAGNTRFGVSWAARGAAAVSRRNDLQMIGELVAGSSFSLSVTPVAVPSARRLTTKSWWFLSHGRAWGRSSDGEAPRGRFREG